SDGTINNTATLIQPPDSNTNLFNWFPTSLLAVYNLITGNNLLLFTNRFFFLIQYFNHIFNTITIGDSGSLSPWTFRENHTMTFLLVAFTFFTVIYLMNLFI